MTENNNQKDTKKSIENYLDNITKIQSELQSISANYNNVFSKLAAGWGDLTKYLDATQSWYSDLNKIIKQPTIQIPGINLPEDVIETIEWQVTHFALVPEGTMPELKKLMDSTNALATLMSKITTKSTTILDEIDNKLANLSAVLEPMKVELPKLEKITVPELKILDPATYVIDPIERIADRVSDMAVFTDNSASEIKEDIKEVKGTIEELKEDVEKIKRVLEKQK